MTQKFLLILSLFLAVPAFCNDPQQSRRLLDFIKTDMLVGIQAIDGTTQLILHIYSKEEYPVAREIAELPRSQSGLRASSLAEKHPSVNAKLQRYIETLPEVDGRDNVVASLMVTPLIKYSFGRVAAVGDDYVLVELDGSSKRRRVIPRHSIGRLELDAEPVSFTRL